MRETISVFVLEMGEGCTPRTPGIQSEFEPGHVKFRDVALGQLCRQKFESPGEPLWTVLELSAARPSAEAQAAPT